MSSIFEEVENLMDMVRELTPEEQRANEECCERYFSDDELYNVEYEEEDDV